MNRVESWFLRRLLAREVRQGFDHDRRITMLYVMITEAVRHEFLEDNEPTIVSFCHERFDAQFPPGYVDRLTGRTREKA